MGAYRALCISLVVTCASGSLLEGLLSGVHEHVHNVANTVKHVIHGGANIDYRQNTGYGYQHPPYPMHQGAQTPDVVNVVVVVKEEDNPAYEHYQHRPPHHQHHGRLPHHGGNQGHGQYGYGNQNNQGHFQHGYGQQNGYGQGHNGGQQDFANQNKPGYGNGNNQGYGQQSGYGYNSNNQKPVNNGNQEVYGNHNYYGCGQNNQNNQQEIPTHFDQMTTPNPGPSEQENPYGFGHPTMLKPLNPVNTYGQKESTNQPNPDNDNDDPLHVALNNPNEYSYGDKDTKEPKRETPTDAEEVPIDVRIGK